MFAILWNWNHRFFGKKLNGVYFAVRILFRANCVIGFPSSSLTSSGSGTLKNTRLLFSTSPSSGSSTFCDCVSVPAVSVVSVVLDRF